MPPSKRALKPDTGKYRVFRAGEETRLREYVAALSKLPRIGWDTETTGLETFGNTREEGSRTVGYCFSHGFGHGVYIPFDHQDPTTGPYPGQMDEDNVFEIVWPLLGASTGPVLVGHNLDFDILMASKDGMEFESSRICCTRNKARVISWATGRWDPKGGHLRTLKALVEELLGLEVLRITDLTDDEGNYWTLNPFLEPVYRYAAADASNALGVDDHLTAIGQEFSLGETMAIENSVQLFVSLMKRAGVQVDVGLCEAKAAEGKVAVAALGTEFKAKLAAELGRPVDDLLISSTKQLAAVLYDPKPDGLQLPVLARTKVGNQPATDKKVLEALAQQFPIVTDLLTYRKLDKNLNAFLSALPKHVNPHTGRVHASFGPLNTETGRFSSSDPNLQQLPREGVVYSIGGVAHAANVRDVIVAAPDHYIFDSDYNQVEYRAMAGEAGETTLIEAFNRGEDVHRRTAAMLYHVEYDAVTKQQRDGGKTNNFAMLYGRGIPALAAALGIGEDEAAALREEYFSRLPAIARWREEVADEAQRVGYVVTRFGRRRWLSEFDSGLRSIRSRGRRQAVNTKIQGACADILKIAMVRLHRAIRGEGLYGLVRPIMTVHDSIALEVHDSVPVPEIARVVRGALVFEVEGWPVISIDCKAGYRYGSLRDYTGDDFEMPERDTTTELEVVSVVGPTSVAALEDNDVDGAGPALVAPPATVLRVSVASFTGEQMARFKGLLADNPGEHKVVMVVNGVEKPLRTRTSLTPESYGWTILGSVRVTWQAEEPDDILAGVHFG